MPRKKRSYTLDIRVIEAFARAAQKNNLSANRYLEKVMLSHATSIGEMPINSEPLGDLRGGDFRSDYYQKNKDDRTTTDEADS